MKEDFKLKHFYYVIGIIILVSINSYYGKHVTEWLKETYPSSKLIMNILGKAIIALGPITLFGMIYFQNKNIVKCIKEGKELPKKIHIHYGKQTEYFNAKELSLTGFIALIAMLLWALFMVVLAYRQGSNFLNLPT